MTSRIIVGDAFETLRTLESDSVQMVCTSPPYWGLRDYGTAQWEGGDPACDHKGKPVPVRAGFNERYFGRRSSDGNKQDELCEPFKDTCGKCGARRLDQQLGLESTPEEHVAAMVAVFEQVRRVLRPDGVLWLNYGDCYAANGERGNHNGEGSSTMGWPGQRAETLNKVAGMKLPKTEHGLKPKDLVGMPWRIAFALQAAGWWLRSDIIWCLSGGTYVYAKTQKGVMPMTIKDMARLDPATVQLWNGEKWTQLLGISRSARKGDELELVLRSGERISCTPTHRFPVERGLLPASEIIPGDVIQTCRLPGPENPRDCVLDIDAAWLAGLYIAEGSKAGDTIQIAGHAKECERWTRLQRIAAKFGGSISKTESGNCMNIRLYGKLLNAILDELVSGRTAGQITRAGTTK